ncbi:alkaline phosphatase D family protein [Lutibacter holmesii]|uniref:Alkaline phosphatase D family protein n=1 Tax=Lutibacter holmesii TaxID=1137985 RepID=A0ABW3WMZ2_9FLAO
MNYFKSLLLLIVLCISCTTKKQSPPNFTIAFGSCNNQVLENTLWSSIEKNKPNVWIWGGDIIYSDTNDMEYLAKNYERQKKDTSYANFAKKVDVLATWDDHDYGMNDGGMEYEQKEASQQLFLDFLDVPKNDARRTQKGIYHSKKYTINNQSVKIILLDTRYFRTALTPDTITKKRYQPTINSAASMLGETQWKWLENELKTSKASYNIIMSSIQFLSAEHGFESWGNMPNEVTKFEGLLKKTQANNVIILSGDRHISEISKKEIEGINYPLIDFTSSGLTHSYTNFTSEPNTYRIVDVVSDKSFGILKIDFSKNEVVMEIRGAENALFRSYTQKYF